MGGPPTQALLQLWKEWEIQSVVLLSFTLQVVLFFFAGIRRYSASSVLKSILWLVYLVADLAATYALGHMSSSSDSSPVHQLVPFWAPFLVLHLGGQDNITAYALEDNRLWLRHLLNLFVQVAGTAYVLYKHIISGGSFFTAAILVLTAGVLKYGERIWALKRAVRAGTDLSWTGLMMGLDIDGVRKTHPMISEGLFFIKAGDLYAMYQYVTLGAHSLLRYNQRSRINLWEDLEKSGESLEQASPSRAEVVYKMIEVELSLMYDQLYTKAAVIHTWYGNCIRAISLATSIAALRIFHTSKKDGYATPDIVITYILLVGALALEITSTLRAVGSIWTCAFYERSGCFRVAHAILFVRYRLLLAFDFVVGWDGRWYDSLGQCNLISMCNSYSTKTGRLFRRVGLGAWWRRFHYTSHAKLSPAVKELVLKKVEEKAWGMIQDGEPYTECLVTSGLDSWALKCMGFHESNLLDWTFQCDFEESILVWHIATTAFLQCTIDKVDGDKDVIRLRESITVLSDYMVYLLTMHRNILPINVANKQLYGSTCWSLTDLWFSFSAENASQGLTGVPTTPHGGMIFYCMKYIVRMDLEKATMVKSCRLNRIMLNIKLDLTKTLQVFAGVWVEMLCHAARHAPGEFHAGQLSKGGEFLTHIMLLMTLIGIKWVTSPRKVTLDLTAEDITEGEDLRRARQVELDVEIPYGADKSGSNGKFEAESV